MSNDFPEWLALVREKAETLRYGVVQIVIHDSKVTQIDCTEKTRIDPNAATENKRSRINCRSTRPDKLEANVTR